MSLNQFKKYDNIFIQCHDNPDADALASGYGLYIYFKQLGKQVQLIYSGPYQIQKNNLLKMIELLSIPITYYIGHKVGGLLITVDCQYGSGNVSLIEADDVAIIDHHQQETFNCPITFIYSNLGSCSTIIWQLLKAVNFPYNDYPNLSTALYYGLLTDTNHFAELYHPLDKDMHDDLKVDQTIIKRLIHSNLSLDEIEIAGLALIHYYYDEHFKYALIKARPCDPNILGVISDMMIQVDCIDTCVVYSSMNAATKLSIRSCVKEVKASELANYLTQHIGSGGGHLEKAGGSINEHLIRQASFDSPIENYLMNRLNEYFNSYEIIDTMHYTLDISGMKVYKKIPMPVGYVVASEFFPKNTPIIIRTLGGDIDLCVLDEFYIIIGINGEAYPIRQEQFIHNYIPCDDVFKPMSMVYFPSIKNKLTGATVSLENVAKSCLPKDAVKIYAKPLDKTVKIFTSWSPDNYMLGQPGDYIATRLDDKQDPYIIKKDIFLRIYKAL